MLFRGAARGSESKPEKANTQCIFVVGPWRVSAAGATGRGGRGTTSLSQALVVTDGWEVQAVTWHCSGLPFLASVCTGGRGCLCNTMLPSPLRLGLRWGWAPLGLQSPPSPPACPFPALSPSYPSRRHLSSHAGLRPVPRLPPILLAHPHTCACMPCCLMKSNICQDPDESRFFQEASEISHDSCQSSSPTAWAPTSL